MLRRGDPVDVERLRLALVGRAAPADQELLRRRLALLDLVFSARAARRRERLPTIDSVADRELREVLARLVGVDVHELAQAPLRRERRQRRLQVDARVAGLRDRLDVGAPEAATALERLVDDEAPDLLERDGARKLLDVDAPVPERRALLVRLGDLRLEGDDALEAQVGGRAHRLILAERCRPPRRVKVLR